MFLTFFVVYLRMIFHTRKLIMPKHLNASRTLYGGQICFWIDEEAAIYAICQLQTHRVVTAGLTALNFTSPAREGDIIEIGVSVVKIGTKSITLKVVVRNKDTKKDICIVEGITFVSVDVEGKPTPHGITEEKKDTLEGS